jgi:hypothetical protein
MKEYTIHVLCKEKIRFITTTTTAAAAAFIVHTPSAYWVIYLHMAWTPHQKLLSRPSHAVACHRPV